MQDRYTRFLDHVTSIQDFVTLDLSEADTRAYLVDPVLRILGYETVRDLRREVTVPATRESLDYALLIDGQPRAIVEAKALRQGIADQHAAQCVQYAAVLGVRWCLITNGLQWALYDAHAKVPLSEKRIAEVRLESEPGAIQRAWDVLRLFSKEEQSKTHPLTDLLVRRVIADELGRADSRAVEALRQAVKQRFGEQVSGAAIVAGLRHLLEGGMLSGTPVELSAGVRTGGTQMERSGPVRPTAGGQPRVTRTRASSRTTLRDLVQAGLLPEDAVLEMRLRGVTYVGQVRQAGIEVNGFVYPSPSAAAGVVRGGAANGWAEWKYKGHTLDQLRRQLASDTSSQSEDSSN